MYFSHQNPGSGSGTESVRFRVETNADSQHCKFYFSVSDPGCLSRIRIFSIPDPNFFHPGSESRNLSIVAQKIVSKLRKYDPGCSSRIRILIFTHPGSRGQKGTRSRIRIRNTVLFLCIIPPVPFSSQLLGVLAPTSLGLRGPGEEERTLHLLRLPAEGAGADPGRRQAGRRRRQDGDAGPTGGQGQQHGPLHALRPHTSHQLFLQVPEPQGKLERKRENTGLLERFREK
jgi:hypothetical protein